LAKEDIRHRSSKVVDTFFSQKMIIIFVAGCDYSAPSLNKEGLGANPSESVLIFEGRMVENPYL